MAHAPIKRPNGDERSCLPCHGLKTNKTSRCGDKGLLKELETNMEITTYSLCEDRMNEAIEDSFSVLRSDVVRSAPKDEDLIEMMVVLGVRKQAGD